MKIDKRLRDYIDRLNGKPKKPERITRKNLFAAAGYYLSGLPEPVRDAILHGVCKFRGQLLCATKGVLTKSLLMGLTSDYWISCPSTRVNERVSLQSERLIQWRKLKAVGSSGRLCFTVPTPSLISGWEAIQLMNRVGADAFQAALGSGRISWEDFWVDLLSRPEVEAIIDGTFTDAYWNIKTGVNQSAPTAENDGLPF